MTRLSVLPIDHVDLTFVPRAWPFADQRRADIDANFAALRMKTPELWNGRVLLLHEWELTERCLRGAFFETDYASFIAWRDWGFPDAAAMNCFGQGALCAADKAFILGLMASHTANAGRIYFPCGTPEPQDVVGDKVDLDANVMREVAEETGLGPDDYEPEPGWHAMLTGSRIALVKMLQLPERADAVRDRILRHLARETMPELADVRIARGPADLTPVMPEFVTAFLRHAWMKDAGR